MSGEIPVVEHRPADFAGPCHIDENDPNAAVGKLAHQQDCQVRTPRRLPAKPPRPGLHRLPSNDPQHSRCRSGRAWASGVSTIGSSAGSSAILGAISGACSVKTVCSGDLFGAGAGGDRRLEGLK